MRLYKLIYMKHFYAKCYNQRYPRNASYALVILLLIGACTQKPSNSTVENISTNSTGISETFLQIDQSVIDSLNRKLQIAKIANAEDIPALYKPKQTETEGNYTYTISSHKLNDSTTELTLIESGLADDAVKGIKTILVVRNKGNQYNIIEMKENYQCYRGHSNWSAEKCN